MKLLAYFVLTLLAATTKFSAQASATDAEHVIIEIMDDCIEHVENGKSPNFEGQRKLPKAHADAILKALNGGHNRMPPETTLWSSGSPLVIQIDQGRPELCEAIGARLDLDSLILAFDSWASSSDRGYTQREPFAKKEPGTSSSRFGGAYLAKSMEDGDHVQISLSIFTETGQTNLTVTRVPHSPAAAELLGEKKQ